MLATFWLQIEPTDHSQNVEEVKQKEQKQSLTDEQIEQVRQREKELLKQEQALQETVFARIYERRVGCGSVNAFFLSHLLFYEKLIRNIKSGD